jgi:hypothetical protein
MSIEDKPIETEPRDNDDGNNQVDHQQHETDVVYFDLEAEVEDIPIANDAAAAAADSQGDNQQDDNQQHQQQQQDNNQQDETEVADLGNEVEVAEGETWFDTWLYAQGQALRKLVSSVIQDLAAVEEKKRERRRKAKDKVTFEACAEAVIANLLLGVMRPREAGSAVAINLSKNRESEFTRYHYNALTKKTLSAVVDLMEDHGFLMRTRGAKGKRTTSISATEHLISLSQHQGVTRDDLGWREEQEVIVLRSSGRSTTPGEYRPRRSSSLVDYDDTELTRRYRAEVVAINKFLAAADIHFIDDGEIPSVLPQDRRLKRSFSYGAGQQPKAWQLGGRLFGGFWISLKSHRRGNIRVQGEPVVLLDFSSMFLRLAYAYVGAGAVLDPDPYDLTGLLEGYDNDLLRRDKQGENRASIRMRKPWRRDVGRA